MLKCVFNRYMIRKLFSNTIISTPININGNISYEGIWKYRKYIIKYININYDEGIAHESFSFKIILRSPCYNHISSNVSMTFI